MSVKPGDAFEYYSNTVYWNNFPEVRSYINKQATGDEDKDWMATLAKFPRAECLLSLNCGNGWVERKLCLDGYANSVVGLDISQGLLDEAQREADQQGLRARYQVMDANNPDLEGFGFDCVLNHAALHHVAYIDRLVREIRKHMPENGLFINYDYVGPHRNQYGETAWARMVTLRDQMPEEFRTKLRYPDLPTMVATDPTEAIHSELIVETLSRYFDLTWIRPLGGAIAYQLLWNNRGLYAERDTELGQKWLQRILDEDRVYTDGRLENSLFAYIICKPKKMPRQSSLDSWTHQEDERERDARENDGRYYPRTALEIIYSGK